MKKAKGKVKQYGYRLPVDVAEGIKKVAKVEGRSATQQVVMVLRKFIEERKKEHERG